jgi:hypothetical protein
MGEGIGGYSDLDQWTARTGFAENLRSTPADLLTDVGHIESQVEEEKKGRKRNPY